MINAFKFQISKKIDYYLFFIKSDSQSQKFKMEIIIFIYLAPIIIVAGVIGNILSLIVYSKKKFNQHTSMGLYFRILAVTDLISVLQLLPFFLKHKYNIDFRGISSVTCKLLMILLYIPPSISAWLNVIISIDRTVYLTKFKHSKNQEGYLKFYYLALIIVPNFFVYFPVLSHYKIKLNNTQTDVISGSNVCVMEDKFVKSILSCLDLLNYSLIPFIIMFLCSCMILKKIFETRRRLYANRRPSTGSGNRRREMKDLQFAITTISLNFVYLMLSLPITIVNILTIYINNDHTIVGFFICSNLYFIKMASPFFVYLIVNSNFRSELYQIFFFN